ncbi:MULTISPECIES: glycosyl hydrolase family 28-related protein [Sphingomonas]|uniref:glycosyl hydrolase family 28-related protein n=1 Tax=Sphingomonas TaxID=13687 RepID=UPI001ACDAB6E|nr:MULTISPECIES: glycosyl hydrolase family 28-related protein [unclassified Sphingomonas]MBN8809798.1 hypothetical protein [Sphingomonas sp.]
MVIAVNSVAGVKAMDVADLSVILDAAGLEGLFFWTEGDFTTQAADTDNIIESDDVPIADGAWVRQTTDAITHAHFAPGAVRRSAAAKLTEWVSVTDFGAKGDADRSGGGTDDTAAIQAAIDASNNVYFPGSRQGRLYKFSNLILKTRTRLHGDGPRASVLRQLPTAMGYALRVVEDLGGPPPAVPVNDISEGAFGFRDLGIEASPLAGTTIGIGPGSCASMLTTENLRIANQHAETLVGEPYSVPPGTVAIAFDGGPGQVGPVFVGDHRNLEIRSFETAVWARNGVNEQNFSSTWIIDCRRAFDLDMISTWSVEASVETKVADARGFVLTGPVGNLNIRGGRYEMLIDGSYLFELGTSAALENVVVSPPPNLLIRGDSGSVFLPGRKVLGAWPKQLYIEGFETFADATKGRRIVAGSRSADSSGSEYQFAVKQLMLGGAAAGNGKFVIGDNSGTADAVLENDGSHFNLSYPGGVRFPQSGGTTGYAHPVWLGSYALWVDGSGTLRIKSGTPASDTDGQVVGSQT